VVWGIAFHYDSTIATTNTNIENNVFAGIGNFGLILNNSLSNPYPTVSLSSMATISFDYNNWKLLTGTGILFGSVASPPNVSMKSWSGTYGHEVHGLIDVDPSFTNQSAADFMPTLGSPLRKAGKNLFSAGVVWDFNKNPRPASGMFTIGAIQ
jgi:hypothetical protein